MEFQLTVALGVYVVIALFMLFVIALAFVVKANSEGRTMTWAEWAAIIILGIIWPVFMLMLLIVAARGKQ